MGLVGWVDGRLDESMHELHFCVYKVAEY